MTELNHNEWLWYVQRSDDESDRGPILRRLKIIAQGPKTVTIQSRSWGSRRIRVSELESFLYFRAPERAIAEFAKRAARWLERAHEDVELAKRDLHFARERTLDSILRESQEETRG